MAERVIEVVVEDVEPRLRSPRERRLERVDLLQRAVRLNNDHGDRGEPDVLAPAPAAEDQIEDLLEASDAGLSHRCPVPPVEDADQPVGVRREPVLVRGPAGRRDGPGAVRQEQIDTWRPGLDKRLIGAYWIIRELHGAQQATIKPAIPAGEQRQPPHHRGVPRGSRPVPPPGSPAP